MDRVEADETPAEQWQSSLNATCNRLSAQYLTLVRSAASAHEIRGGTGNDPRSGGGIMHEPSEPPPPLAADASLSSLQAKLAAQNLCVAAGNLLDLTRTLRLSALLMDEETIYAEETEECLDCRDAAEMAVRESARVTAELMKMKNDVDDSASKPNL
mmetsp:Transcript_56489/g.169000  ORF Transcript_56489/g.169000 Transcript_56489/m.169000 type:complete len:157 (-) Transcript_56489:104-574(-)|eukprot:CAMPEP_0113558916 /NCGR_PEP_ID=MMETSP0015_2-20120614/18613_1 /TAXON_ID=2838 /ORGANISM="Odontella" /LENGTH=156 /DNA_ID=CAMNT_0000460507 /DNA_START=208 /DNA_END=678 /DNA_ORIENTATION=+ /assembly_acc=CAM_ASM_000160